jgi:cytidyltransferase-like protein
MTETKEPVRVFTAMVADLFHYGHARFLRAAASLGDHLTVGLISDDRAASYKRRPILTYAEREEVLQGCRYVDDVLKLDENITNSFMDHHNFHVRAYACATDTEEARNFATLWKDMDRRYFRRIEYTEDISTSDIISRLQNRFDI